MAIGVGSRVRVLVVGSHPDDQFLLGEIVTITHVVSDSYWPYRADGWMFSANEIEEV